MVFIIQYFKFVCWQFNKKCQVGFQPLESRTTCQISLIISINLGKFLFSNSLKYPKFNRPNRKGPLLLCKNQITSPSFPSMLVSISVIKLTVVLKNVQYYLINSAFSQLFISWHLCMYKLMIFSHAYM